MLATASAQVYVPLGHSSLYFRISSYSVDSMSLVSGVRVNFVIINLFARLSYRGVFTVNPSQ